MQVNGNDDGEAATVERYVRHANLFGDAGAVYETAERDSLLSATGLGDVAARLRRLDPKRHGNSRRVGRGYSVYWPAFKLNDRQKDRLGHRLLEAEVPAKRISTYLGVSLRWVKGRTDYWCAVSEWVRIVGVDPGKGIGPPVDLLDAAVPPSLYRALSGVLGHRSNPAESTRDRQSTSGMGGGIVAVGLRFERLEVVRIERDDTGRKVAVCRCDCGTETIAKPSHLVRGEKRSCGCLRRERMAAIGNRREVPA